MKRPPPDPVAILREAGWEAADEPVAVTAGWDNHLWRFERAGRTYGLRLPRFDPNAAPGEQRRLVDYEAAAQETARTAGLPAPVIEARSEFDGLPFVIMEWLPGQTLLDIARHKPWLARRLGREFGRLQARLHTISGDGLRPIAATDWISRAEHPALIAHIQALLETADTRFCHFDFHPLNVLAEGTSITGLLDFTNASACDPRADVGLTNALLVAAPLPPGAARRAVGAVRRRFIVGWREGYLDFSGRFPLEPAFEALGYGIYYHEFASAMSQGRGWAQPRDLARLKQLRDERIEAAGLAVS